MQTYSLDPLAFKLDSGGENEISRQATFTINVKYDYF